MKSILSLAILVTCYVGFAQNNHPTIDKITANCKSVPQSGSYNVADIKCIPQATISLKTTNNIKKIHLKLVDIQTNVQVYQTSYLLSSTVQTNTSGNKLFENMNGVIFISPGDQLTLKPMRYEVQTEDNQGNLSVVFSEVH